MGDASHAGGRGRRPPSSPAPTPAALTSRQLEEDAVVQAQAQLGHPREENLQLDAAHNLAEQHAAIGAHLRAPDPALVLVSPPLVWSQSHHHHRYGTSPTTTTNTTCLVTVPPPSPLWPQSHQHHWFGPSPTTVMVPVPPPPVWSQIHHHHQFGPSPTTTTNTTGLIPVPQPPVWP